MNRSLPIIVLAAASLVGSAALSAQQASSAAQAGFSVDTLIQQLSYYIPAREGALGNAAPPGAATGGAQQGTQSANRAPVAGAQTGQDAQGANAVRVQRDPKLYLTKGQIDKLLPIMNDLKANPYPTPSKGKKIQADVDAILTKAQKDGWVKFQKELEKMRENLQAQRSGQAQGQSGQQGQTFAQRQGGADAPGAGAQGAGGAFRNFPDMTDQERQQFLDSLPADQRKQIEDRLKQSAAQPRITPAEQRQRQIEQFIKELQDRRKELG